MWFSESGTWKAFIDGKMRKTVTDLTPYRPGIGYLVIGRFQGSLAHFNIWDKDIGFGDPLRDLGRSLITGNVVPWPEVQFWRSGNVTKKKSSLCKLSGEECKYMQRGHHWKAVKQVLQAIVFRRLWRCSSCYCWFSHNVIKIQTT